MKKRLESFEAKKLDTSQMYSVLGGIAASASTTDSKGGLTRTTGADDDSKTSDGDADEATPKLGFSDSFQGPGQ